MDLADILFPKKCLGCSKEGVYICKKCLGDVPKAPLFCTKCLGASKGGLTHPGCRKNHSLEGLISLWRYKGIIRKAILALKYKFAFDIVSELSDIASRELKKYHFLPKGILVPVPSHWYRANWRGFNQAEELGKRIAKNLGYRFIPDLLLKKKHTRAQTELKKEQRQKNISGAFGLNPKYKIKGGRMTIVVFDDVWTTGSTLKEAAEVLKNAGIKKVWGLTLVNVR